jgi:hypothetical protein
MHEQYAAPVLDPFWLSEPLVDQLKVFFAYCTPRLALLLPPR